MEGMMVSASTGVMSSLLSKLSVLLSDQYKQLKGVRRDIESLSRELTDMNAALVKLAGREKLDVQTKVWRDKVREMAYDIEDIIDIFMHHHDQARDDKDGLFHKAARKIRKLRVRHQIAGMIQDIKVRVEEHSQSRDRYKVEESVSNCRVVEVDPRMHALFEDAKRLVGIEGPREEITKWLMEEDDCHSRQLKVLSIVGFGGLGKTTLANQVYAKIKNEFEYTAFVSVSRTPHMPKILKGILTEVGYGGMVEMEDDVQKLIEILRATLSNKRYFVIIDDLWSIKDWRTIECAFVGNNNRLYLFCHILMHKRDGVRSYLHCRYFVIIDDLWSIKDWRTIECAFVGNNNASRVITTTRIQDVATASCIPSQGHVYQMQPLNELHSRRLFFKRLFDTDDSCPEQFKQISDDMLRKCKGVPLAITSIASLLANHMQVEIWEMIYNSLGSQLDTNPTLEWMRHVLSLSYNDLSHELKTCLLYLGMYPEDSKISKEDLLRKWIAEGFVREKHGLDLEEVAENCFNELINRSMIQPCFNEYNFSEVSACQIHDLMLELIIWECKEENFITIIDRKFVMNGSSKVRRISHQFHNRDMTLTIESTSASQVRSYISFMADYMPPFTKFELLRVLDIEEGSSTVLTSLDLSAVNHIFLLRYLRVGSFVVKLPKKFSKLKHLMTIDMSKSWLFGLGEQVSDFSDLSSLRHLSLLGPVGFRNGLSKLCNLRDLSWFHFGTNSIETIRDLGELTNLRDLTVIYSYSKPGGVENNLKATILAASLNKLGNSNLRCLDFHVLSTVGPSAQFWSNCLSRPRHMQKLLLDGITMPKLPNWIAHADRLAHASLGVQQLQSDDIQVLAQLPCLIYLQLRAKTIRDNNITIRPNTFHSLKRFYFVCELSRFSFEPAAMPRLQRLDISLDDIGQGAVLLQGGNPVVGIEHLASLEEIHVFIRPKCDVVSQLKSAWREAINRHPKSQAIQIFVD